MSVTVMAVRGAAGIESIGDEKQIMVQTMGELMNALEEKNHFSANDIVSVQFTQTSDLHQKNAAGALREAKPEYGNVPLFCSTEPEIDGSAGRLVRVLVTWRAPFSPVHPVYLGHAAALRPDLLK